MGPGQTVIKPLPSCTATVTRHAPARSVFCRTGENVRVDPEGAQLPLSLERIAQAAEVARRRRERGFLDLDVVQADDRVDVDGMGVRLFPHDLPVHLALRGNIDHERPFDTCGAAEASPRRETSVGRIGALESR